MCHAQAGNQQPKQRKGRHDVCTDIESVQGKQKSEERKKRVGDQPHLEPERVYLKGYNVLIDGLVEEKYVPLIEKGWVGIAETVDYLQRVTGRSVLAVQLLINFGGLMCPPSHAGLVYLKVEGDVYFGMSALPGFDQSQLLVPRRWVMNLATFLSEGVQAVVWDSQYKSMKYALMADGSYQKLMFTPSEFKWRLSGVKFVPEESHIRGLVPPI